MHSPSLFDLGDNVCDTTLENQPKVGKQLDVVKTHFLGVETMTWQELFSGYDNIFAITYSSDINFIYKLLDLFKTGEVIFGCEETMSYSLQEIMAYQCKLMERMREEMGDTKDKLIGRIEKEDIRFFVCRNKISHQKIYLLSAEDGRKRVVFGSANMSFSAFSGKQAENISYCDDEGAYDWYMSCYISLKEDCSDAITKNALLLSDDSENLDKLPYNETIAVKKALVIQTIEEAKEDVQFVLDVHGLAKKLAPCVPKANKKGIILLDATKAKIIKKQAIEEKSKERERRNEYPQLKIDVENGKVELNGSKVGLDPSEDEIKHDVDLFLRYMNGYNNFHGDVTGMQARYFEFANWFFCSPFMGSFRNIAVRYNQNLLPYPVFGLVYGQSKAGKTSFLETLLKMMIGQKTKMSAPDFTRSSIEQIKRTVQGAPVIVDDLTNTRFNQHAIETIKNDDFGITENLIHYPAVVISANEDVKAVAPEVIRRTVICRVQAGLTNTEVMRSSIVRTVQRNIGTAFYREYLRRMMIVVPELIEELKSDESESAPDILSVSSGIIIEILNEYSDGELPGFVRLVTLEDYFSEKVTGKYAIKTIQDAWKTSKSSFEISEKANELRYNAGAPWEADRIKKELPETLEAHKSRDWLVMNLQEARNFFGINFEKSFFDKFRR